MQKFMSTCGLAWSWSGNLYLAVQVCLYLTWSIQEGRLLRYREFSRKFDDTMCDPLLEIREWLLARKRGKKNRD